MLIVDRPGYGGSGRCAGRRIADVVVDVVAATELHGWDRFAIWGGSGGGPHALACAALLGDRVERCASVVGPAPYDAEGLDWFDGMSPGNVEEFSRVLEGEAAFRPLVERLSREAIEAIRAEALPLSADYELPESDRAALRARLSDPGNRDRMVATFSGVDGWIDDCIAMTTPWGFDPTAITVPVSVWYGSGDALCPTGHSEWLVRNVPGAERHELPGGHVLDDAALDAIHAWLVDQ